MKRKFTSKFFSFRVGLFSERLRVSTRKKEVTRVFLFVVPAIKMTENLSSA